jgi:hypothetical protein
MRPPECVETARRTVLLAPILLVAAALGGCAVEPVYEGARTQQAGRSLPSDPAPRAGLPSYQDYEAERKKLQGADR